MSEPYVGEIRMFAGTFAPRGWAMCDGQLLQVSQNDTLFALIGTTYGGDGQTTFGLPDLRGRIPIHMGTGAGLSHYYEGQMGGSESVTLTVGTMPAHTHPMHGSSSLGSTRNPSGNLPAQWTAGDAYINEPPSVPMGSALSAAGGNQSHSNMQPFLCLNFIISLFGIYPSPS